MTILPSGCSYTNIWVSPENWKTISEKKGMAVKWYVQCNFIDPRFPKPYQYRRKLNKYKDVATRRAAVEYLLEEIPKLFDRGYNPITNEYAKPPEPKVNVIEPSTDLCTAMSLAAKKVPGTPQHKREVRIAVDRFNKSAVKLGYDQLAVGCLKFGVFSDIVDDMNLPDSYFNSCRSYFMAVCKVLRKHECIPANFGAELDKKKVLSKPREVLEQWQVDAIFENLRINQYHFYRYAKIFYSSATRSTEYFAVQKKHVRIDRQEYDVVLLKGDQYEWETKVILREMLPLWNELLQECKSENDYLFSTGLQPGRGHISPKQVTRRWHRHVKSKLAFYEGKLFEIEELESRGITDYERITADFYALKHAFLDMIDQKQGEGALVDPEVVNAVMSLPIDDTKKKVLLSSLASSMDFDAAQRMAAHRTVSITNKVYKKNKEKREKEILKKVVLGLTKNTQKL